MNRSGGEAFAKLAQQLNRARLQAQGGGGGGKGGGQMPGFKGFMAGGGLLAVLAGGGLILNYSLFNGTSTLYPLLSSSLDNVIEEIVRSPLTISRWWSSSDQVFEITWYSIRYLPRRNSSSGMFLSFAFYVCLLPHTPPQSHKSHEQSIVSLNRDDLP